MVIGWLLGIGDWLVLVLVIAMVNLVIGWLLNSPICFPQYGWLSIGDWLIIPQKFPIYTCFPMNVPFPHDFLHIPHNITIVFILKNSEYS